MLVLLAVLLLYPLGALVDGLLSAPCATEWAPCVLFRRWALGLLLAVWLGVTLAQLGHFAAPALLALLLVLAWLLLAWHLYRGTARALLGVGAWRDGRELAVLGGLLALGVLLFARPGEDVLGARDPGIYYATGAAIARGGGVLQHDPALAALSANLQGESINYWLFQSVHGWPLRFPGQLFVRDLALGVVEPGFMPWYPTLLAAAIGLGDVGAGLWVNPALATLALVAVYLVGRIAFGPLAAALGAALLALNLAAVWFARYTLAEPAAQLLVWTGLYAAAAARQRPTLALALLGGLAWSGMLLARVDTVLLLPIVVGYLVWQSRLPEQRRWAGVTLGALALGTVQAAWHAWQLAPGYASMTFSRATLAVAAGGVVLSLVLGAAAWAYAAWRPKTRLPVVALLALLAAAALFAYLVRPLLPAPALAGEPAELDMAARESLVRLGWYVTPWGLLLALLGAGALVVTGRWRRAPLLLALLALQLAFYLPNPLVSADHPWAARRYLPVVLPVLLLLAAYGACAVGAWATARCPSRAALARLLPLALALLVALGEWQAMRPIAAYREHAGALAQTRALAALLPADALVLFPRSAAGLRLTLPLHYLGERASFVLPADGFEPGVVPVVARWLAEGRTVYWVVPRGARFPTPAGLRLRPAGEFEFVVPQLERPIDRLPAGAEEQRFALQLYRLERAPEP